MPDIDMCTNSLCPLRDKCYRYRAHPTPHGQSYARFEWEPLHDPDGLIPPRPSCEHRLDIYHRKEVRPTADVDRLWKGGAA